MDRLERDLQGQAEVMRLSVWSAVGRQLAARYGVRGVPTYLLFDRQGEMVEAQAGRLDAVKMRMAVDAMLPQQR